MHDLELICRGHQVFWKKIISHHRCTVWNWMIHLTMFFSVFSKRLSKMDTNFLRSDSWLHYFQRQITVVNSIMLAVWWQLMNRFCVPSRFVIFYYYMVLYSIWLIDWTCCFTDIETIREKSEISVQFDKQHKSDQLSKISG